MKRSSFQKVIREGNNLPRFMLLESWTNFDKNNRKLLMSIGRTEWSQTSYVWDVFGKKEGNEIRSSELMKEYAGGIANGPQSEPYLPNSLCLHLLIETNDSKVILTRISQGKRNDNPGTIAATLGEQLEMKDFLDGNNFHEDFILRWVQRSFKEEYKFDEITYYDIVDESSVRVLSLDFESDRYNFALLCVVRINCSFKTFQDKESTTLSTDEASELMPLNIDDIPKELNKYKDTKEVINYHPSTFLRLLVFFIHKNGYARAENKILACCREAE